MGFLWRWEMGPLIYFIFYRRCFKCSSGAKKRQMLSVYLSLYKSFRVSLFSPQCRLLWLSVGEYIQVIKPYVSFDRPRNEYNATRMQLNLYRLPWLITFPVYDTWNSIFNPQTPFWIKALAVDADKILRSAGTVTQTGVSLKMIHGAQSTPEGKIERCWALWLRTSRANWTHMRLPANFCLYNMSESNRSAVLLAKKKKKRCRKLLCSWDLLSLLTAFCVKLQAASFSTNNKIKYKCKFHPILHSQGSVCFGD